MMKKNIFIWMVSFIGIAIPTISATAQTNNEKKETLSLPEKPAQQTDGTFKPKLLPDSTTSLPLLPVELSASGLFLFPDANTFRYNPLMWNYDLSDTTKISTRFSYIPFNQQVTYIGLGEYNNIGASLLWKTTDKLSLETSAFISKQFGYMSFFRQISFGTGLKLNYDITNKLLFRSWGQYITPGNNDPFLKVSNLFPKTNIGVELQYKATDKTDVGIGVEYQYDKESSTWKPESGGKVKIGF